MSTLEIIKKRRSIRGYQQKKIPKDLISQLKESIIWAPSAGNLQARKFYFVYNYQKKQKLAESAQGQDFISDAPLLVVACADLGKISIRYGERGKNIYSICDVAVSLQNLMLLATELGLGTCWVGAIDEEEVREILNLSKNLKPIAIVPVGYTTEKPEAPSRVSIEEAVEKVE